MATDYDAPRKTEEDLSEDSLQELQARRSDKNSGVVDEDETEAAEGFELPGADLSGEELSVRVLPRQADEFTCSQLLPRAPPQPAGLREGRQPSARSALPERSAPRTTTAGTPRGPAGAASPRSAGHGSAPCCAARTGRPSRSGRRVETSQ